MQANALTKFGKYFLFAYAFDMGTTELRLFPDTRKIKFKPITSWIPGEKRQGMLRYKLSAWVNKPTHHFDGNTKGDEETDKFDLDDSEAVAKLLERVSHCRIELALYDKDEFILRQHVWFLSSKA